LPAGTPLRVTETTPEQLSLAVAVPSAASLTTVEQLLTEPDDTVMPAGTESAGAVVSFTVTVVVAVLVLPAASVAVIVTVCGPVPTSVPAAGLCVSVTLPEQLSLAVAVAVTFGIAAWQFASAEIVIGDGAVTEGGVLSLTVTV
jgi:hypothetical protein